ncbi:MAG: hypothetical protein WCX88_01765 [Patescibacteria group bacterium]
MNKSEQKYLGIGTQESKGKIKTTDKFEKQKPCFESCEFSPYEWGTVLLMIIPMLYDIARNEPKNSRWVLDLRLFKVVKKVVPAKRGDYYQFKK